MTTPETAALLGILRTIRGHRQVDLAERAGLSQTAVSNLEKGKHASDEAVRAAAEALGVTAEYVLGATELIPASRPLLRSYHDAHKATVDEHLAIADFLGDFVSRARLRTVRNQFPTFDGDLADDDAIDEHALDVRRAGRVADDEPVGNTIQVAENLGCVLLPLDDELGRHLGMSTWVDGRPYIFVARARGHVSDVPGDRQRFTVSHELGHIALHEDARVPKDASEARALERQAHRFAGAFLIPTDAVLHEHARMRERVTLTSLSRVKARWGIAIKALVKRWSGLNLIDNDKARSLYKQISARGWTRNEPVEVVGESGRWLRRALELQAPAGADPIEWAAKSTGVPGDILRALIRWEATQRTVSQLQPHSSVEHEDRVQPGAKPDNVIPIGRAR